MDTRIVKKGGGVVLRDDRYATLEEMAGPQTGLFKLSAAYVVVDSGRTSPRHWHASTEEIYAVVSGRGVMSIGNRNFEVSVGDCISIPVNTVHAIGG
jgi:mannose-6-phosphate isomerase-like protein (cupin superfamily)